MSKEEKTEFKPTQSYGPGYVVFDYQIARIEGKVLTLIESLGLKDTQEKATKDLARDIIQGLYRDTRYITGELATMCIIEMEIDQMNGKGSVSGSQPAYTPAF